MDTRANETVATRDSTAPQQAADNRANESTLAQVYLQPIAAPSILGLYGFAAATFIVAAHLAGWYGGSTTLEYLFPFAAVFGGIAQFIAGMWAYKARDGLATAMHGMWGSFWAGFGARHARRRFGPLSGRIPRGQRKLADNRRMGAPALGCAGLLYG